MAKREEIVSKQSGVYGQRRGSLCSGGELLWWLTDGKISGLNVVDT